jgi:F-type H+-transporting ATPase subunit delta
MANNGSSSPRSDASDTDVSARQVADAYAKALVGATENAGQTQAVLGELDSFVDDVLAKLPKLEAVLGSAMVTSEAKRDLLGRALRGRASTLFLNFLKVVAEHGRLDVLQAIRRAAYSLLDQLRGRVPWHVVTARPLDNNQLARLTEQLRQLEGGQPYLIPTTDPKLIGGIVLRVEDRVYDGSVATRLTRVRQQMIDRSVHEIQRRRDRFSYPAGN